MSRNPANSLLNSLKGKIWIATTAMAFFVCIFGFVSYLLVSFIVANTLYAVLIPFVFVAISVIIFGWWLSSEVNLPLERLSLIAKTLERGVTSSFPNTSGSVETDEILESLKRIGLQMQRLVVSMEEVMRGDLKNASLGSADRLNQTFQRLLGKLSESIKAKNELEKLNEEIEELSRRIASLRFDKGSIELDFSVKKIREIAANFSVLFDDCKGASERIERVISRGYKDATEVQLSLASAIEANERETRQIEIALTELRKFPSVIRRISEELSHSTEWVKFSVDQVNDRRSFVKENLKLFSLVRSKARDLLLRIKQMEQVFEEIDMLEKQIEDISRRLELLFLSLEISSSNKTELVEEIPVLAKRMENICKQMTNVRQFLGKQVESFSTQLESMIKEVGKIDQLMLEVEESMESLRGNVTRFVDSQEKLVSFSQEQMQQIEKAFQILVRSASETGTTTESLKESALKLNHLVELIKDLRKTSEKLL